METGIMIEIYTLWVYIYVRAGAFMWMDFIVLFFWLIIFIVL